MLAVLKNDRMREKEKKKEVESLLGTLAEERFALLVNLGKKITDWVQEEKMQIGRLFYFSCNQIHEEKKKGEKYMHINSINFIFNHIK